ncbi:hypothetical protein ABZY19_32715 [Streptomyces sp. NPDC006475]|uniref:hypothetical protein n=1 Tax=Streptomyces sp. NPDC006475 TaxID=3155719 RepID=UPI0033B9D7D8
MQREGGLGRENPGRFAPGEEKLSTEDIARTDTEPAEPSRLAAPSAPVSPPAKPAMPPRRKEMTDAAPAEPGERTTPATEDIRPSATEKTSHKTDTPSHDEEAVPLLDSGTEGDMRSRWSDIQQGFVDDPQAAVRSADALVAEVMQLLATTFADHKEGLEKQWHQGNEVATEDLRIALRQYRSFFDRLLTT